MILGGSVLHGGRDCAFRQSFVMLAKSFYQSLFPHSLENFSFIPKQVLKLKFITSRVNFLSPTASENFVSLSMGFYSTLFKYIPFKNISFPEVTFECMRLSVSKN